MKGITKKLLQFITDIKEEWKDDPLTAYNLREDCQSIARLSTQHITITSKEELPGIDVKIAAGTKGERVYIPVCITESNIDDLVYNDFYVGENAEVTIVAGCGIHTQSEEESRHNGIHRFHIEKGAVVTYIEKHLGIGSTNQPSRIMNPVTEVELQKDAIFRMETSQIGGITQTQRKTIAVVEKNARLIIRERILTEDNQYAKTTFQVELNGEESTAELSSRSVARGTSYQEYHSTVVGNVTCRGHSECDGIITERGRVSASPRLLANHPDATLIHEAAIGKIASDQIIKLQTLGLTKKEAEATIIKGFLT